MNKLKKILAVLLAAAIFIGTGSHEVSAKSSDFVIVLDAGHGGSDGGASGNRLYEKALNLKIAQYCKTELEKYQGVKVYMTRTSDTYVGLDQRVLIAAKVKADAFVSIHINSASDPAATGAEVFYPNSNYRPLIGAQGKRLADSIQKNLVSLGLKNRGTKVLNSLIGSKYPDGSLADYYAVIKGSKQAGFPGVIVEHAFISNPSDAKVYLSSSAALKRFGAADAKGIADCYGLKKAGGEKETLPKTNIVKLAGKTSASVSLAWERVKGAGGYEIFRSASKKGGYQQIASVKKAKTTTYNDKTVENGKTYYYKVRAYKMDGDSKIIGAYSSAQKVKLLKTPKVTVRQQSSSRAKVSWKKISGALKYEVYRSVSKDGKYQKIATVQKATSYRDTKRKSNQEYYYSVRAVGGGIRENTYSSYGTVE